MTSGGTLAHRTGDRSSTKYVGGSGHCPKRGPKPPKGKK